MTGEPGDHQKGGLFTCLPTTPSSGLSLGLCESRVAAQLSMEEKARAVVRSPTQLFPWKARAKENLGVTPHWPVISHLSNFLPFTVHCGLREVEN